MCPLLIAYNISIFGTLHASVRERRWQFASGNIILLIFASPVRYIIRLNQIKANTPLANIHPQQKTRNPLANHSYRKMAENYPRITWQELETQESFSRRTQRRRTKPCRACKATHTLVSLPRSCTLRFTVNQLLYSVLWVMENKQVLVNAVNKKKYTVQGRVISFNRVVNV